MKTIDATIFVGFLFFIGTLGIFYLVDDISQTDNISLDEESLNLVSAYNGLNNNLRANQSFSTLNTTGLPNYDGVAAEFRESAESKGSIQQFTSIWDIMVNMPAVMIASLPFMDLESSRYIAIIVITFLGILTIYNFIGLYSAWKTGRTD